MRRLDFKAIAVATACSFALDVIGSFVLLAYFGGSRLGEGMSETQTTDTIRAIAQAPEFLLASILYGSATSVLGGYLAARLARSHPYFNALGVGVAGILLGLALGSGDTPAWYTLLGLVSTPLLAVLGGHLWQLRQGGRNK